MFLINKIAPLIFLLSLCVGLFFCYIFAPTPDIIIKYPTPENTSKEIYKDDADNCFKFISEIVKCPNDISKISSIPIQNKAIKENFKLQEMKSIKNKK